MSVPVSISGFGPGDIIIPRTPKRQNDGTSFEIIKGGYPPSKADRQNLGVSLDSAVLELMKLSKYKNWGYGKVKKYLQDVSINTGDLYLTSTGQDIVVKIKSIGGDFKKKMTEDNIEYLLNKEETTLREWYYLIPTTKGQYLEEKSAEGLAKIKGTSQHTLLFRPSLWGVKIEEELDENYAGGVYNLTEHKLNKTNKKEKLLLLEMFDSAEIAISVPDEKDNLKKKDYYDVISKEFDFDIEEIYEVDNLISWFTPAIHKSLIQKIIRTGCEEVESINKKKYSSELVLCVSFLSLYFSAGSFVPDLNTFVKGSESALKRLAVSIVEDSYCEDYYIILELLICAALSRKYDTFKPTEDLMLRWMEAGMDAIFESRMWDYDLYGKYNSSYSFKNKYSFAAGMLNTIKAFPTDISMFYTIREEKLRKTSTKNIIKVMPIYHCLDHHSVTEIAYYFPTLRIDYSELFDIIWSVTGVNPRKGMKIGKDEPSKEVRKAQELLWVARENKPKKLKYIKENIDLEGNIDASWLSGLVGPIYLTLKNKKHVYVCLRPDDIYDLVAVEKITNQKQKKDDEEDKLVSLTPEEMQESVKLAKEKLRNGIVVKSPEWLGVTKVYLKDNEYYVFVNNKKKKWKSVLETSTSFKLFEEKKVTFENSLKYSGEGIMAIGEEEHGFDIVFDLIDNMEYKVKQRLLVYLSGTKKSLSCYNIGRLGQGSEYVVVPEDTEVFRFWCKISLLVPGILKRSVTSPSKKFDILFEPAIREIKEYVESGLSHQKRKNKWKKIKETWGRKLREYQRESLNKLITSNRHGNIIWMDMGAGKTFIIMSYIKWLIDNKEMPEYCIYALPPGAVDSVRKEIEAFEAEYVVIDMAKKSKHRRPEKYKINLMTQDTLKNKQLLPEIKDIASDLFLINDEMHYTLNPTQRTSAMLEVSKLCWRFVGMSGTVVKDRRIKYLIPWLEQVVSFEVTDKNFWAAMTVMISKKINLEIEVRRLEEKVEFLDNDAEGYAKYMIAGSREAFRQAIGYCRRACEEGIIDLALGMYNKKKIMLICAENKSAQGYFKKEFMKEGIDEEEIYLIGKNTPLTYKPGDKRNIRIIITTPTHVTGYTLTKATVLITSVYFVGQHVRDQLEGRLIRIGQEKRVDIYTVTVGILSDMMKNYAQVRNINSAFRFALEKK